MLSYFILGFHKNVSDKLILGVRGKIYSSIYNVSSVNNSGYIYTVPSTQGVYEQQIFSNLNSTLGLSKYNDENYEPNVVKDILPKELYRW
jgi:hypothetical protein